MYIFDGHCDVLWKMWEHQDPALFYKSTELHGAYERLKKGKVMVQTMAIYVPTHIRNEKKTDVAFDMLDLFYENIYTRDHIHLVKNREDLLRIQNANLNSIRTDKQLQKDDDLYILLALEGSDPLQGELRYLRLLHRLGVRSMGLTWNESNQVADGVRVPKPKGLTHFGRQVVREMNRLKMAIDVSHIAEKGFWECLELSTQPVMASHSNAKSLCAHPRNLTDEQITSIIQSGGVIGIAFVPEFLADRDPITPLTVLKHVEYMLSLGGENHIAFGSDFDGIELTVDGLEHSAHWQTLVNLLLEHYPEQLVMKMCYHNWTNFYIRLWSPIAI